MNRNLKPTKSVKQIKNEQIALMLAEIEKNIDSFKIVLGNKDKQLVDFKKLLKAAKTEYQKIVRENKYFKEYILTNKNEKSINKKHK